jgi:fibronectin-binding autotransporter adhesin
MNTRAKNWSAALVGMLTLQLQMSALADSPPIKIGDAIDGSVSALTIAAVSIAEGTGGATNLVFTVTASPSASSPFTVNFATSNGTAVAIGDYTPQSGQLSFTAGAATRTISVPINTDSTVEGNETFTVTLSGVSTGATIATPSAIGTITNDDTAVISANAPAQAEGNVGNTPMPFTLSISNPVQGAVSLSYATADGNNVNSLLNATIADNDYIATSGSLGFASDSTTPLSLNVPIVGDTDVEPNQSFLLNLSNLVLPAGIAAGSVTFASPSTTGTINNDDGTIVSIANASLIEGNAGNSNMNFTVSLSNPNKTPVTVQYTSAPGTATVGGDYTAVSGTLTFPANVQTQTIAVPIVGDTIVEANETFTVTISAPSGASLGTAIATGTINNDDTATLSVNSLAQAEGNAGNTPMNFTVTLSNAVQGTVTATVNTADGNNATALLNATIADNDYLAVSNASVSISSGLTQTVPVQIVGDTDVEPNQSFRLILSNLVLPAGIPAGAITFGTTTGIGTINNDDATSMSVANASVTEGNAGTTVLNFTVSLTAPNKDPVTVNFATSPGTATPGTDYVASSGTLTIPSNVLSAQIPITINGDTLFENDETINLTLSAPVGATLSAATAVGTIIDDEQITLSIADATAPEGNDVGSAGVLNFVVTLAGGPSTLPITVQYASANGTAIAPDDYPAVNGTLTFAPGETSKTITVTVVSDLLQEFNETFSLTLSNLSPVSPRIVLARAVAIGTIQSDDFPRPVPTLDWRSLLLLAMVLVFIGARSIVKR